MPTLMSWGRIRTGYAPIAPCPPPCPRWCSASATVHHRCPGGPLAILESDIFLHRLLARDLITDGPPRVRRNTVSQGYDLDRFMVRLRD
jgi:cytochrome P450